MQIERVRPKRLLFGLIPIYLRYPWRLFSEGLSDRIDV